jgi:error-prone DNA polymerase
MAKQNKRAICVGFCMGFLAEGQGLCPWTPLESASPDLRFWKARRMTVQGDRRMRQSWRGPRGQSPLAFTYIELQVTSNYSFLRGASHVEELFAQAKLYGYAAIGIADRNSLAGIARAQQRADEAGIRLIIGCRLDLADGASVLVYPTGRDAYARLCRMLSLGKSRAGKGKCHLDWSDLGAHAEGLIAILVPGAPDEKLRADLVKLKTLFGDRAYLALTLHRRPGDAARLHSLSVMAQATRVSTVATNDVLYHAATRRILHDVITCIREGCTIDDAGFARTRTADRHLKPPEDMARLFDRYPEAVASSQEIADRCRFSLGELRYQYPHEVRVPGMTAQQTLEKHVWEGAAHRYGKVVPEKVAAQIRHELMLIGSLNYAPYFLTVEHIVRFARSRGILCQGRGSAANSAVCFVLGITAIDPVQSNLLFERFISAERREPPDIDVDFEHERREEVIQWIFATYGRDRAALCATVIRYRSRGAVRDVGKALGLTEDVTASLAGQVWGWSSDGVDEDHAAALNLNIADRRLALTLKLARELIGFPRHLSQHPGGFVLTQDRLDTLVPVEPASMKDRQVIEWDKDDIDYLGFMKVDVLGLGMLGCMRRAFDLLSAHRGMQMGMADIPQEDPATYRMIQRADTVGVFQIESRAQMSMLPRMKPKTFYDLVIEVAIVRPGPIQGDMVHPYLRRREGLEKPEYPTPELRAVLEKTLGVPLFQEQAMKVAIACAGFSPTEADQLRRSMATFKVTGGVSRFHTQLIDGMTQRGYSREFAERTFKQIEGFGSYGFPESHAASFALIAYASSWLKCHHPDMFACALLNAQPMGFYAPAQIVRDAQQHGVEIRPVSVNDSRWDCTLEPAGTQYMALRLGLRMVKGLANKDAATLIGGRGDTPFESIAELHQRTRLHPYALERLAEADAFSCLGKTDRRRALWEVRALVCADLPLFAGREDFSEPAADILKMKPGREVVEDYRSVGLTLRRHPVAFLRDELTGLRARRAEELAGLRDGTRVMVAGIVLVRQRPGSAKGVMFITIEDETGHANLIVWPKLFEKQRSLVLSAGMLGCHGILQREGEVIHVVAGKLVDFSGMLRSVGARDENFVVPVGRGDEVKHGGGDARTLKVATRDFR